MLQQKIPSNYAIEQLILAWQDYKICGTVIDLGIIQTGDD